MVTFCRRMFTCCQILLLLVALCASMSAASAGRSCCPRTSATVSQPHVPLVKPMLVASSFRPLQTFQPEYLIKQMLSASVSAAVAPADHCAFMAEARRWQAWRNRNPHAPSRFPNAPKASAIAELSISPLVLNFGSTEPEPDPSVLGCGCDPWDGCGVLHSTFGSLY
jgi:hypothetical protein